MNLVRKFFLHLTNIQESQKDNSTYKTLMFALLVLAIVLPIRIFIAKPFIVSGTSMYPTFDTWHYLIIDQITYRLEEPKRGDVVVFKYPRNPSRFFIKRVIALPGETIQLKGTETMIKNADNPDWFILPEEYVAEGYKKPSNMTVTLGQGEYFVMGDNRSASADSRYWGPLDEGEIVGRALVRLFPFAEAETFPGTIIY